MARPTLGDRIAALEARIRELEADRVRMDWLSQYDLTADPNPCGVPAGIRIGPVDYRHKTLRQAIDTARQVE